MGLRVILSARPTVKMSNLLSVLFRHSSFPSGNATEAGLVYHACSEAPSSRGASVGCYRGTKDIFSVPIVETKNKLVEIQRQIFSGHAVISSDHATLQQRPKTFDALR